MNKQQFSNAVAMLIAAQGNEGAAKTLVERGFIPKPVVAGTHQCGRCGKKISANKTHCFRCTQLLAVGAGNLDAASQEAYQFERELASQQERCEEGKKLVQLRP